MAKIRKCHQCGKPAVAFNEDLKLALCVDCWDKLSQLLERQNVQLAQTANFLLDIADARVGLPPGFTPRYHVPKPTIHEGPMTFNNIRVDRSVIGAINTGQVQSLDVALSNIKVTGENRLAEALQGFTEAILAESTFDPEQKNKLIEQTSFLAEQVTLPETQRKKGVARVVLSDIANTVSALSGLASLWQQVSALLQAFF